MQRIEERGLLRALAGGQEAAIERMLQSEVPLAEEERKRGRTPPGESRLPPRPVRPRLARDVRRLLASRGSLRQAMIMHDVLGPPRSLRPG